MFAGHLGAAIIMKKADPEVNLGLLFFATLLLDFLLGFFVTIGLEQVHIAPVYRGIEDQTYAFPYSHSLAASLLWSGLAFLVTLWLFRRSRLRLLAGLTVAATVFSHWVLDMLVHVPEMPLFGTGSPKFGLGLYAQPVLEVGLEVVLVLIGLAVYLRTATGVPRARQYVLVGLMLLMAFLTAAGTLSGAPADPSQTAMTWLIEAPVIAAIAFWIDRPATKPQQQTARAGAA
ncbi:MAG: hypothetical protein U0822_26605 [Anaerolineae bacterium]